MIAVTRDAPDRDPARWDLIAGDLARAAGAPVEAVQVLSVTRTGGDYLVHVQLTCPVAGVDPLRSDCACGRPVDVEGGMDGLDEDTVYVEDAGFWHRSCAERAKAEAVSE